MFMFTFNQMRKVCYFVKSIKAVKQCPFHFMRTVKIILTRICRSLVGRINSPYQHTTEKRIFTKNRLKKFIIITLYINTTFKRNVYAAWMKEPLSCLTYPRICYDVPMIIFIQIKFYVFYIKDFFTFTYGDFI